MTEILALPLQFAMPRRVRHSLWRSLRRRLSAGLTLLAYLVTVFGVPLPAGAAPCAGAACGCASEEECHGGSCCCAKPAAVKPKPAPPHVKKSCCSGGPGCTMPCCQHDTPSGPCVHETPPQPGDDSETPKPADDDAPADGVRWIMGIAAMQCRGQSTLWVSTGVVLPAPAPLTTRLGLDPVGWVSYANEMTVPRHSAPPDPPPRARPA